MTREATGSSIPHLDQERVKRIRIPWPDTDVRTRLGTKVIKALENRDIANENEIAAVKRVENSIRSLAL